jgi:Bacterial Ig-like domain (group 2)
MVRGLAWGGLWLWLAGCGPAVAKLQLDTPEVRVFSEQGVTVRVLAFDAQGQVIPNTAVRWQSSAPEVATIDERKPERQSDGTFAYRVQAGESGVAWLTARADHASVELRALVGLPKAVVVDPAAVKLSGPGQTQTLTVSVRDERGQPIPGVPVWFRLAAGDGMLGGSPVAAELVDGGIGLTAQALGRVGLMVLSGPTGPGDGGQEPAGTLRVMVPIEVARPPAPPPPPRPPAPAFTVAPATATLRVGQVLALQARLDSSPVRGKVRWKSLSPKLLSVNGKGKAKARRRGKVDVIATFGKSSARASLVIR